MIYVYNDSESSHDKIEDWMDKVGITYQTHFTGYVIPRSLEPKRYWGLYSKKDVTLFKLRWGE